MAERNLSGQKITKHKVAFNKSSDLFRLNKPEISLPSRRNYEIVQYYIAIKMLKTFRYLPWMSGNEVIGPEGERINQHGEIYTPSAKSRRTK